jgi:hypothetical protein
MAQDHLQNRLADLPSSDSAIGDRAASAEAKMESAVIKAVGDIWANLTENAKADETGADSNGFTCKYKPAPEYAIERGRLLAGSSGSTSFFEEETSGFYNAPSRIARDPRFRPASKEGVKPKAEDDWKHRHEMYGRRRM